MTAALHQFPEAERIHGIFAELLPARKPTLRDLWIAAAEASEAVSAHLAATEAVGEDIELTRLENAAHDTEQSLRDHLLSEHGLTTADLKRSVL